MPVLFESFLTVVPVFLVILLGYFLRRRFDETFIKKASVLQFYVAMPALVLSSPSRIVLYPGPAKAGAFHPGFLSCQHRDYRLCARTKRCRA